MITMFYSLTHWVSTVQPFPCGHSHRVGDRKQMDWWWTAMEISWCGPWNELMIAELLEISVERHTTDFLAIIPWAVSKLHCEGSHNVSPVICIVW